MAVDCLLLSACYAPASSLMENFDLDFERAGSCGWAKRVFDDDSGCFDCCFGGRPWLLI